VRLSDIMGAMHLSSYAEIALVLFLAAFAAISLHVFRNQHAADWELARHLPLELTDGEESSKRHTP
jgi:cbb3-type cytochrome oxidase subunit 3